MNGWKRNSLPLFPHNTDFFKSSHGKKGYTGPSAPARDQHSKPTAKRLLEKHARAVSRKALLGCADLGTRRNCVLVTFIGASLRSRFTWNGTLLHGLDPGEGTDHEEQVHQPECEPRSPDDKKPNRKEDQAWIEEQQGVTEQPETVASREYRARSASSIRLPTEDQ